MKRVHFMGIGGSGASAIAAIAEAQGFIVSGCDLQPENQFTIRFARAQLIKGHNPDHLSGVDTLAISPAITSLDRDNPEIIAAKDQGIETLTWQEFMGKYLEKDKFVIAVCGTHGKSTTTAMIGLMLEDAGFDPTVELGAIVPRWAANYRIGKSQYFITEADEYNNNFLVSHPDITVVTNIEMDHPEFFRSFQEYKDSFEKFFSQSKEVVQTEDLEPINFDLKVPGRFNKRNATAAYAVGLKLGINPEQIKKSLQSFTGISRRFELVGETGGTIIYSDFCHHPTEIQVTLQALREKFPQEKIWVVFQPHMFSRTKALFDDFVRALNEAPVNQVIITDIYPSRETDTGLVNSQQLVEVIAKPSVSYLPQDQILDFVKGHFTSGVLIFQGAGDIDNLARELVK